MERSDINPWLGIWIAPKKTIRSILDTHPRKWILLFSIVAGALGGLLLPLILKPQLSSFFIMLVLIIGVIGGAILGLLSLYFEGWIYTLTGSWIGGKGTFVDLKCAVGWKNYPSILTALLYGLTILAIPNPWLEALFGFLYLVFGIWGFIILVNLVGEAHRFSAWRGFFTVIIAMILVIFAILIISLLIPLLSPLFQ